jgi:hypothetical protein
MENENEILNPENQEQEEPKLRGTAQTAILGKSYVSSYTGPEIDFGSATVYYYVEQQPAESGNYWHYVDGVPTPW